MGDLLSEGMERLGLPGTARELGLLRAYADQIALWNRRTNLVRASGEDLVVRHLLDSLAAARLIGELAAAGPVADAGSGAGLPGIPLAIVLPRLRFALIERAATRAAFLRGCAALLGLSNVEVLEADVTSLAPRAFPLVVFRAFRPLARSLREVEGILAPGGTAAAYAGRLESLRQELSGLPPGFSLVRIEALEVPFLDAERHLALLTYAPLPTEAPPAAARGATPAARNVDKNKPRSYDSP